MASTVSAGTLKVKIIEEIKLNGKDQGGVISFNIASITEVYKRIIACTASQTTTIATFANDVYETVGAIDIEDSKYIRVTNLDAANAIELAIVTVYTTYQVKLDAGQSHILGSADDLLLAEADTSPSFGTMTDLGKVVCKPNGSAVNIEVFIASA